MKKTINYMTKCAILVAIICVLAGISIPIGPVSITLATLGVYLVGCLVKPKYALLVIACYIALGAMGLPVFSNWSGGIAKLIGPTGGYILGYLVCVLVQSMIITRFKNKLWVYFVATLFGTVFIYFFGTLYFMVSTNNFNLGPVLMVTMVPFLPLDTVKIIVAPLVSYKLRNVLDKQLGEVEGKKLVNKTIVNETK